MKQKSRSALSLAPAVLLPGRSWAWARKLIGVADGDTITVLHDKQPEEIRRLGIGCPETVHDLGRKAKSFASDVVFHGFVGMETITVNTMTEEHNFSRVSFQNRLIGLLFEQ